MNRVTAVLLAAGAFLVHVLAVYRAGDGTFGLPFEQAYVAFGLARHLAFDGQLVWDLNGGAGGLESYPSPLLIALAWIPERFGLVVTKFMQGVGIACTLATILASTRFDTDRIAGVVPAILLVSCTALAVAGPSATEWPLLTALLTTAFVAQEKSRPRALMAALVLLVATRPEGVLLALLLALQALLARRPDLLRAYAPAAVAAAALELAGAGYARLLLDALSPDATRAAAGLAALWDFARTTVAPALLIFPLVALVLGELSGVGRRALALGSAWLVIATLEGGGPWALQLAFVPALPLLFVAVEQGISRALDTYVPAMERLAWAALAAAVLASGLMSRFPGDLGPLHLEPIYDRLLAASAEPPPGHTPRLARDALHHELALTRELRRLGLFVRDGLPGDATVVTPWPGVIGYLAHATVIDLFGRTTPQGDGPPRPWWPTRPRARLLEALALDPDYVMMSLQPRGGNESGFLPQSIVRRERLVEPGYQAALRTELVDYELVTCPSLGLPRGVEPTPITLLRRRRPEIWPVLELRREGGEIVALATPPPALPSLLARLEITVKRGDGSTAWFAPDGSLHDDPRVARGVFELRASTEPSPPLHLGRYPVPADALAVEARFVQPDAGLGTDLVGLAQARRLAW